MYSLPQRPLLHMALTAGLSALKTPACHSKFVSPSSGLNTSTSPAQRQSVPSSPNGYESLDNIEDIMNTDSVDAGSGATSLTTSVCPICSTELNRLAKRVPFAHHTKSNVEHDPVVLPNGRIYGRERLMRLNEKLGTPEGFVRDPVDISKPPFRWEDVGKVYIS
jgi:macrophage erythroblast attacher